MIDPRYLSVVEWADFVCLAISVTAPPMKLQDPSQWVIWAYTIIAVPSVAAFSPPDPRGFSDWRTWAERFVEAVPL